jgi:outer membrane protein assembly factor BamB
MLVARDAFNGVLLWKRPLTRWEDHLRPFRSGPAELPRRLVAHQDRLFVTLGYGEPVTALDGATGETLQRFDETGEAQEILYADGKLFVVAGKQPVRQQRSRLPELPEWLIPYPQYVYRFPPKHLVCINTDDGKVLWQRQDPQTRHVLPLTLATDQQRVFFQNEESLVALDAETGETAWMAARPISLHRYAWSTPTVVVCDGVVLSGDRTSEEVMRLDGEASNVKPRSPELSGSFLPAMICLAARSWRFPQQLATISGPCRATRASMRRSTCL